MKRLALLLGLMTASATPALAQPACPADFQNQPAPMTCHCAPEAGMSGTVWGSGIYTTDSRICRAAIHAGVIQAGGGVVVVTPAPGQPSYAGSAAHGVTTSTYGPWANAFTVAAPGEAGTLMACPTTFETQSAPLSCLCSAEATTAGTVWGSDIYTNDSRICRAAVHAGAIPASGGQVHIRPVPGQQSYVGGTANGVTTTDYGSWGGSFSFQPSGAK